ncbi:MAG: Fic family protein [Clostridia bacterium]|nr:Fic family protein [Clostridia bacterium]
MLASVLNIETYELSEVIKTYTNALDLLDDYDHQRINKPKGNETIYRLEYDEARKIIDSMKFNNDSTLFGLEKEKGKLEGILETIYQNVFGTELYPTLEDKAAHLLYFLVKDHPFADGCKRIAATLFLEFLNKNKRLIRNGKIIISNNTLVAITLLTAESNPEEMELMVNVIMHLLIEEDNV